MQIYAHRGASQTHSENTIGAFAEALRLGVDGIELDIHATSDDIPVVIHDSSLSRTLGKEAHVTELPFEYLRSIAPMVPTFAEVLGPRRVGSSLRYRSQAGWHRARDSRPAGDLSRISLVNLLL